MLFHCWLSVADGGPAIKLHWASASCFQGMRQGFFMVILGVSYHQEESVENRKQILFSIALMLGERLGRWPSLGR